MEGQTQKLGVPMLINTTLHQDQFLTQDLLNELVWYMYYCFNHLAPKAWFTQAMQMRMQMQGFTHVSYPNANDNANAIVIARNENFSFPDNITPWITQ